MPARSTRTAPTRARSPRAAGAVRSARPPRTVPADADAALAQLSVTADPDLLKAVRGYRPAATDAGWDQLATHVRLGLLAGALATGTAPTRYAYAVTGHVRAAVARGADLSVPGIWAFEQVEHTLALGVPGLEDRSVDAMAAPLRRISRALVPAGQPPQPTRSRRHQPGAPYDTGELADLVQAVTTLAVPLWRARASLLLALTAGAGLTDADLFTLTAGSLTDPGGVLAVTVRGDRARTVPVFTDLADLARAGLTLLLEADPRLDEPGTALFPHRAAAGYVWHRLTWPEGTPRPTTHRLRATWTALVLAAGCGLPAFLRAAHITSVESWYGAVTHLQDLDEGTYLTQVRGGTVPGGDATGTTGRELDGRPWPAPAVPLRTPPHQRLDQPRGRR